MLVHAEVTCLSCGHVAGDVRGDYATLTRSFEFFPETERDRAALLSNGTLRCPRCGGPVYLEGMEPLRLRKRVDITASDFTDPFAMSQYALSRSRTETHDAGEEGPESPADYPTSRRNSLRVVPQNSSNNARPPDLTSKDRRAAPKRAATA
jgi:hypothetical protein